MRTDKERQQMFDSAVGQWMSDDFRKYLVENGFFVKPASISHHSNHTGGLFDHSFEVMAVLEDITKRFDIQWQDKRSPYIVGMFHDLCKMDDYVDENAKTVISPQYDKAGIFD